MSATKPFKIAVSDSSLSQLKAKLSASSLPAEVDFSDSWDYGTPLSDIKRLAIYWRDHFDWRAQERLINEKLPQFTTTVEVDGFGLLNMHFVHQKGKGKKNIPLLFCHGWPGSFLEVMKILPLLTEGKDGVSFDVVAPSLPNYAFSEGVKKKGFGTPSYAEAIHKVMLNLGYDKYVTQGGDWGFHITRLVGVMYPEHCLASHLNLIVATKEDVKPYLESSDVSLTQQEKDGIARTIWFHDKGMGYNLEQSTRPSTIGFALADSPIALLAWIYEKLHDWTDSYPWTDDEILTWISMYQFSVAGPEASARIYYELMNAQKELTKQRYDYNGKVKLGISYFPRDICVPPSDFGRKLGDVVFERRHKDGGHFAAHERPELLVADLLEMFGPEGGAKDVVLKVAV